MTTGARALVTSIALAVLCTAGCARHVVALPEDVARYDDDDWTVTSEPSSQPAEPGARPR